MTRTEENFYWVKSLAQTGISDYQIAPLTGVNRSTVLRWRHRDRPPQAAEPAELWQVVHPSAYCYLLGWWLGDGHVTCHQPATWVLRISCDRNIFRDHCELLGLRVRQSNHRNLTVCHRDSVAVLEQIVGPKT